MSTDDNRPNAGGAGEPVLKSPGTDRWAGGCFSTTRATFAAMALYDHFDGEQRARVVIPMADHNRRHWNFLRESGRRGVALGTWRTTALCAR